MPEPANAASQQEEGGPPARYGNDAAVEASIAVLRGVLEEERNRIRHLDTRVGTVAGFCATVLTLNVTFGRGLLVADVPTATATIIQVCFVLSVVALAGAVAAAAVTLMPRDHQDLTEEAINSYANEKLTWEADLVRLNWVATLGKLALSDRKTGDKMAKHSKRPTYLFAIGLGGLLGEALAFALGR